MELDDLKSAWQTLNDTMAKQHALDLRRFRDQKLERARRGLRPLQWGQSLQIPLGALLSLWSGAFWTSHLHTPHLLVTGLVMHGYGLAMILFGARTLVLTARVDYGAPVLEIQRNLAELRRFYSLRYAWIGLPWWVLWMFMLEMVVVGTLHIDPYANIPTAVVHPMLAVGVLGWAASLGLGAWTRRHPSHGPRFRAAIEGESLTRAQTALDEIARFEAEGK